VRAHVGAQSESKFRGVPLEPLTRPAEQMGAWCAPGARVYVKVRGQASELPSPPYVLGS
jgi:hypothetical protein